MRQAHNLKNLISFLFENVLNYILIRLIFKLNPKTYHYYLALYENPKTYHYYLALYESIAIETELK